ncbi:MAG TPA: DUF4145 domain-containing protein, partial [Candidatus Nanoarchaeia archaeon]|nr:DUF4145 domain-containing protein [Candidatus Nanoarchaeia archaeon]
MPNLSFIYNLGIQHAKLKLSLEDLKDSLLNEISNLLQGKKAEKLPIYNFSSIPSHLKSLHSSVNKANQDIEKFNKLLKQLDFPLIVKINPDSIDNLLVEVPSRNDPKTIPILLNKYEMQLNNALEKTLSSFSLIEKPLQEKNFHELKNIDQKYLNDIQEALDLFSLGYYRTSNLVISRALEQVIDDYLKFLKDKNILTLDSRELSKINFDERLDLLKSKNLLNERDITKIKAIKFDRNIASHFTSQSNIKKSVEDAEVNIKTAINQIRIIQELIK